jgi:hypothetical protein
LERLERREVLSAGGARALAALPGRIEAPGHLAHLSLTIERGQVTSDRSTPVYLGFTADPATGADVSPRIASVFGPTGLHAAVDKARDNPFIIRINPTADAPSAFAVDVVGLDDKVGDFVLDAFLPGDVDSNGSVDQADLRSVRAAYGSYEGQPTYNASADFNRDGRVGCLDFELTRRNLGAHASAITVTPPPPAPPAPAPVPAPVVPPAPVAVTPVPQQPVVVASVPQQPVVVASVPQQPVVVASIPQQPVVVTPVPQQPVVVTSVPQQPVVLATVPQAPAPQAQPVQAVPVTVAPGPVVQAPVYGYGQPVNLVPVYGYAQPAGSVPVGSAPVVQASAPAYTYGQPVGTVPVYVYGQPVVQGPGSGLPRSG